MTSSSFLSQTLHSLLFMKAALNLSLQPLHIFALKGTSWVFPGSLRHLMIMSENSDCSWGQSSLSLTYSSSSSEHTRQYSTYLSESLMIWVHLLQIFPIWEMRWRRLLLFLHSSSISLVRLLWKSWAQREGYFT